MYLPIMILPLAYLHPIKDLPAWLIATIFFTPMVGGLTYYFYRTRHAKTWRKGLFPQSLKLNEDNLLEAYLALGALFILLDYQKSKGKTQYINQYFNRYFTKANYNFGDSLLFSMNHPIQIDSISTWFNKHLPRESERSQVIYFLAGLSYLNGQPSMRELQFLSVLNSKLHLPESELQRIISIYESYQFSQAESEKQRTEASSTKKPSKARNYANILSIKIDASQTEVKKAYRTLVKKHHPDAFANASEVQKKLAEEKFVQIQEAYEFFSK